MHYEHNFENKIEINQYTIERFFYTSHILESFYGILQSEEGEADALSEFYSKLYEKFSEDKKVRSSIIQLEAGEDFQQSFAMNAHVLKEQFLKTEEIEQSHLILLQLLCPSGTYFFNSE